MPQQPRFWNGRAVHFAPPGLASVYDSRGYELGLTEDAARKLALTLGRAKQTYFSLPAEVEEIINALDYVLVADPRSVAEHSRMENAKGMTPDGGYREPEAGPGRRVDDAGRPV